MAFKFTIPFYAFKLHFHSGGELLVPLSDPGALNIGQPLHLLAGRYAEAFQRKLLNKGNFQPLLDEYGGKQMKKDKVIIPFPASKDRISYPKFELEFTYFYAPQSNGYWGIIPSLGIESFAKDLARLTKHLKEALRVDFARKKRLSVVQQIVSAIWFDLIEVQKQEIGLMTASPRELEKISEESQEQLLPKAAQELKISKRVIYGRKEEIEKFFQALKGKFNRNVLLVGASGVGKTALVWEIARQQKKRRLKNRIWETTAATLIKELMRDTGWQDNLSFLCKELAASNDFLFISNLMELFEVGKYEGNSVSIADYLRTFISRGEVNLISECTEEELAQIELRSPNYLSLFQVLRIEEPKVDLEEIILKKVIDIAQNRNNVIQEDAIKEVIRLNKRFTPYSGMPGKPIRFLESILVNRQSQEIGSSFAPASITRSEIIRHFCEETGMPAFMVDPSIPMRVEKIKKDFNENLYGQENAVKGVVDLLAAVKTALTRSGKPIASFLFVGPTGVGKTELAKILAGFMFGNRNRMIRFDMSEYSSPYSIMRLTGANYFTEGLLTAAIRREPFCVLLFDEIEKAHSSFFDLLLQVLSEGRLTDSQGKLVNFCSTIIIMTSNIGASKLQTNRISWDKRIDAASISSQFLQEVQKHFRPELFNRIDQVIPFEPLDQTTVRFVIEREIDLFKKREGIQFRRMDLHIEDEVLDYLALEGYNHKYGARHLQRTIREHLIIPLSRQLNLEDFDDQLVVKVRFEKQQVKIQIDADPLGVELLLEEWDKNNNANHASSLRRQISILKESHFYIQLQSQLEILEREKKRKKNKFWEDRAKGEKYSYYLETINKVQQLCENIEALEMDLSLSCLNLGEYNEEMVEKTEQWEKDFFDLKIELYSRLYPKSNTCHFAIYGNNITPILKFYLELFKEKEFQFEAQEVWFRESHYTHKIKKLQEEHEYVYSEENGASSNAYIKQTFKSKIGKPPKEKDHLFGIEFVLSKDCVFLFLKEEEGMQKWKLSDDYDQYYVIKVENNAFETPLKIHRQEFYRSRNPRRIIGVQHIQDIPFKINREYHKNDLLPIITQKLDENFKLNLNVEIF